MSDFDAITRAYLMAADAHIGQFRKGPGQVPYINHPCAVAALVGAASSDSATIIAAVLHDVVEDTPITLHEIEQEFGAVVAGYVLALTNPPEWEEMPMPERKAAQAAKIASAVPQVQMVKLADQTCNLRDLIGAIDVWPVERQRNYLKGAQAIADNCKGTCAQLDAAFATAADTLLAHINRREP